MKDIVNKITSLLNNNHGVDSKDITVIKERLNAAFPQDYILMTVNPEDVGNRVSATIQRSPPCWRLRQRSSNLFMKSVPEEGWLDLLEERVGSSWPSTLDQALIPVIAATSIITKPIMEIKGWNWTPSTRLRDRKSVV